MTTLIAHCEQSRGSRVCYKCWRLQYRPTVAGLLRPARESCHSCPWGPLAVGTTQARMRPSGWGP